MFDDYNSFFKGKGDGRPRPWRPRRTARKKGGVWSPLVSLRCGPASHRSRWRLPCRRPDVPSPLPV